MYNTVFVLCLFSAAAVIVVLGSYPNHCHVPPSLWCSSREIAATCQVEKQCFQWKTRKEHVNFTLYYESLCPDCQQFILGQLNTAFKKVGSIMNLQLVPFGNAREKRDSSGWKFTCQHGPDECKLNVIETCVIHMLRNVTSYFPVIHGIEQCLMELDDIMKCVQMVSKKFDVNYNALVNCANSKQGVMYEHQMALKTNALNPSHTFVPWVTLNGVHTMEIQDKAETDLVSLICETYQGPDKSKHCPTTSPTTHHVSRSDY